MIFTSGTLSYVYLPWVDARLAKCLNRYLNVKVVVAAFNQEKAFSVITNLRMDLFEALVFTALKAINVELCLKLQDPPTHKEVR